MEEDEDADEEARRQQDKADSFVILLQFTPHINIKSTRKRDCSGTTTFDVLRHLIYTTTSF